MLAATGAGATLDLTSHTVGFAALIIFVVTYIVVMSMNPDMPLGHWLLVTLTAGVGGSILSIGSAAGVALMGQARGKYTFSATSSGHR